MSIFIKMKKNHHLKMKQYMRYAEVNSSAS